MKKKILITCFFFLLCSKISFSQDTDSKWIMGIGSGAVLYSKEDVSRIGFRYVQQFPRLSVGRYLFNKVALVAHFSSSVDGNKKYSTFDVDVRYDFGTSQNKLSMYALVGGSLVDTKFLLPLINIGGGGTLWISDKVGLNGQLMYKINNNGFQSQATHLFGSGGLVFRFDFNQSGSGGRSRRGIGSRKRLWDLKH